MMTRPLDAAMAFANLHRRWFDDAQGVTDANRRQACDAAGSLVVDVLTLWDENECDYLADAPFLIRLEECDIAAFVMRRPYIALFIGRIETDEPAMEKLPPLFVRDRPAGRKLRAAHRRKRAYCRARNNPR